MFILCKWFILLLGLDVAIILNVEDAIYISMCVYFWCTTVENGVKEGSHFVRVVGVENRTELGTYVQSPGG